MPSLLYAFEGYPRHLDVDSSTHPWRVKIPNLLLNAICTLLLIHDEKVKLC